MRTSFTWVELALIGDQPLTGALRLRVSGTGRLETHRARTEDARSLYF